MKPNYYKQMKKPQLTEAIYQYPGQHSQSLRSELVSLSGQALATQTINQG